MIELLAQFAHRGTNRDILRAILKTQILILRKLGTEEHHIMALQASLDADETALEAVLTAIATDLDEIKTELATQVGEPLTQATVDKFTALTDSFKNLQKSADALVPPAPPAP